MMLRTEVSRDQLCQSSGSTDKLGASIVVESVVAVAATGVEGLSAIFGSDIVVVKYRKKS